MDLLHDTVSAMAAVISPPRHIRRRLNKLFLDEKSVFVIPLLLLLLLKSLHVVIDR